MNHMKLNINKPNTKMLQKSPNCCFFKQPLGCRPAGPAGLENDAFWGALETVLENRDWQAPKCLPIAKALNINLKGTA